MSDIKVLVFRFRRHVVIGTALLLVLVLVGGVWVRAWGSDRYRTGTAELGSVTATITSAGSIDASERRDIATAVAGTVASVKVAVGDEVSAGDLLVSLDWEEARRSVRRARATLAQAKVDLESARSAQTSAVASASGGTSGQVSPKTSAGSTQKSENKGVIGTAGSGSTTPQMPGNSSEPVPEVSLPVVDAITSAQDAVIAAQTAATAALADAAAALDQRNQICQDLAADDDSADEACAQALTAVRDAQDAAAAQQTALQEAITTLTTAVSEAIEGTRSALDILQDWYETHASNSAPTTPSGSDSDNEDSNNTPDESAAKAPSTATPSAEVPSSETPSASNSTPSSQSLAGNSAQSIAAAQASIDEAKAELTAAKQDFEATRIRATIAGTVTAVDVAADEDVAAGDAVVTVVGDGGATVELSLVSSTVPHVEVGQEAAVLVPGATDAVVGSVTWVSPVAASSGGGTTWLAHVHVAADELAERVLPQGARVDVTITVGTSEDVLTVPTSAILNSDESQVVRVLTGGEVDSRTVEIGSIGAGRTEIVSGLAAGDEVILADLSADIDAAGEVRSAGSGSAVMRGGPPMNGGGPSLSSGGPR